MPLKSEFIIGLRGLCLEKVSQEDTVVFTVRLKGKPVCPHCGAKRLRLKDSFFRLIRHRSLGVSSTSLRIRVHKYLCRVCGKYFNSRIDGVLPYKKSSQKLVEEVFYKHTNGISQSALARNLKLSDATVERYFQEKLKLNLSMLKNRSCPRVLGIDEHFFTRRKGYATTFCDLTSHRVFDVALGRSRQSLHGFLSSLKGRDKVKVVVIDMADTYRVIARKYFPNALIVADRFHVIRLINHVFLKTWKRFDESGRKNRALLSLMRRHFWNLSIEQQKSLRNYLHQFPHLEAIYDFKQRLVRTMLEKHKTQKSVRPVIQEFFSQIKELLNTPVEELISLGKTLQSWSEEIGRMWRFTKTNSITEGIHNKMELISRRAYGFRNFQNYRIRVLVLCSQSL